jgi:hypothetical protein
MLSWIDWDDLESCWQFCRWEEGEAAFKRCARAFNQEATEMGDTVYNCIDVSGDSGVGVSPLGISAHVIGIKVTHVIRIRID